MLVRLWLADVSKETRVPRGEVKFQIKGAGMGLKFTGLTGNEQRAIRASWTCAFKTDQKVRERLMNGQVFVPKSKHTTLGHWTNCYI